MKIAPFTIEQFFARYEFTTPHLLCASDCETMQVDELLALAGVSLSDLGRLRLNYTESQGNPALRTAVAQNYSGISPDQVVILTAPEEGIYLAMRTVLEPGDHVIVLTPAYDSLYNMAQHITGNASRWDLQPAAAGWRLDMEALAAMASPATKLIVVNFPHNPTGFLPTLDELEAVIEIARQNGAWLFCDEMYRGLELADTPPLPSAAVLYPKSLVLSGLSKVHGLPGLRSGWLIVQDGETRDALINWKHYTSICPPAPSEFLALAALKVGDKLAVRSRNIISRNLAAAQKFFERWPVLFSWRPPQAGSVALVGLNVPSATDYCHHLAREAGVLLLPSSCLGYGDNHVRLGLGRADFQTGLAVYEKYLETQPDGPTNSE